MHLTGRKREEYPAGVIEIRTPDGEIVARRDTLAQAERYCLFAASSYTELELARDGEVLVKVTSSEPHDLSDSNR